ASCGTSRRNTSTSAVVGAPSTLTLAARGSDDSAMYVSLPPSPVTKSASRSIRVESPPTASSAYAERDGVEAVEAQAEAWQFEDAEALEVARGWDVDRLGYSG
ncbi:MAG: hypothetical protein OXK79_06980, partial [Chloroflexota bacterium]|nr:hypothetical protein [Chloroflexota bacterium]